MSIILSPWQHSDYYAAHIRSIKDSTDFAASIYYQDSKYCYHIFNRISWKILDSKLPPALEFSDPETAMKMVDVILVSYFNCKLIDKELNKEDCDKILSLL